MTTRTYGPVTRQQAEQFLSEAANNGLTVHRDADTSGSVTGYGKDVGFTYDAAQQRITLTVRRHLPFLENVVWDQVEQRLPPGVARVA